MTVPWVWGRAHAGGLALWLTRGSGCPAGQGEGREGAPQGVPVPLSDKDGAAWCCTVTAHPVCALGLLPLPCAVPAACLVLLWCWGVWPSLTPPALPHWDMGGSLFIFLPSPLSISNLLPREAGGGGSHTRLSALGQVEDIFGKNYSLWIIPACWALPRCVTAKVTWVLTAAPAK